MDFQNSNLPLGFAMTSLLEDNVRAGDNPLTEAEKEKMIFKYKDAENEAEKEQIRNAVPPEDDMKDIFGGPSIG